MLAAFVMFTQPERFNMSDATATKPNTTDKPKASRTSKQVAFSSCHVRFANAKGIDVTRAAKLNRSYVRSNFETLTKVWPALKASQKKNADSNRYPDTMPAKVADAIVTRSLPRQKESK